MKKIKKQQLMLEIDEYVSAHAVKRGMYSKIIDKISLQDPIGNTYDFRLRALAEPGIPMFFLEIGRGPGTCMSEGIDVQGMETLARWFKCTSVHAWERQRKLAKKCCKFKNRLRRNLCQ